MAAGFSKSSFHAMFMAMAMMMVASMQFHGTVAQTTHVVGDALGWTIPPGGSAAYTTWASLQTFTVGDILLFNYNVGVHDVAEVSQAAYGPCTSTNPISLVTTSPATLTLTTPGTHYYICTFGGHCQNGQKLTINVSTATPPSATPPPTTTPTTPVSPPPTTTPTTPVSPPTTTTPSDPCPPTSSPSSSPSSPPSTSGLSPTGSTTPPPPPPPPNSGAPSLTAVVPVTFLAIALAFLNY